MIPNIVHFNYGLIPQEEEFLFVYYIAVLSCKLINKPDKIFFYYHYEPHGIWWEKTKLLVDLIKVDIPTHIGDKELKKTAHRSDILRMNILCKYGGIYLDIDTICVRSYKDLLYNKCVMAQEMTDSGKFMGLCNAIMMAEPNSKFMKEWYDLYEEHFEADGWQEASTFLPHRLSLTSSEITVLPRNSFLYPSWDKINLIFTDTYDINPELFILHFWNHHAEDEIVKIKNFDWIIEYPHTLYAKLLMNVYSKIVELPSQYLYQKLVYDDIINTINVSIYNKLNSTTFITNKEAQEHYILNKNNNLICNPLFRNDLRLCELCAFKVFEVNININEIENCFIDKIENYYRIKLLNSINKLVLSESKILYNLNKEEQIYIFPENFKITQPIKNIIIKPNISIFDTKFIISTHYI